MKKFLCVLCTLPLLASAQDMQIREKTALKQSAIEGAHHPILNAEGTMVLFTKSNFTGLYLYDISNQVVTTITEAPGAGYGATFTPDNQSIWFKEDETVKGRRFKSLMKYKINTSDKVRMSEPMRNLSEIYQVQRSYAPQMKESGVNVYTNGLKLMLERNGVAQEINPIDGATGYIWVSLSPDKQKILLTATSKGTFVIDLEGNILASLGMMNAPTWYGDSFVLGMKDEDDGHRLISSQVWAYNLDTKTQQQLSADNEVAVYPSGNIDAQKVVYATEDGNLFLLDVELKK